MKLTIFHIARSFFTIKPSYNGLGALRPVLVFAVFRRTGWWGLVMLKHWCLVVMRH